jgi:hypothetical protein
MLKTATLTWSLQNSLKTHEGYKITETNKKTYDIATEYDKIKSLTETEKEKNILNSGANISSALDILIAFEELTNVVLYGHTEANTGYVATLKKIITDNFTKLETEKPNNEANKKNTSELSLIFDKKVSIPNDYGTDERGVQYDHYINKNDRNEDYEYTADISYGNPNVFYEKYWHMNDTDGEFLYTYHYFVPTNLNLYKGANLYRMMTDIAYFIIIISVVLTGIYGTYSLFNDRDDDNDNVFKRIWDILFPLFALVVFLTFIIVFIRFNTNFNKDVVYKCLDCSYKRALNKLNNIVNPYIRMYDTKITTGNKNYLHHYIISNVFYSLLSGNINLVDTTETRAINTAFDGKNYKGIDEIKTNRLKLTEMNDSLLNNDNQFREYYKSRYGDLYNTSTTAEIDKLYNVFLNIFGAYSGTPVLDTDINDYFKTTVLKKETIFKIFSIIKRCFELFNVERFNNNLVYYNNRDKGRGDVAKKITIDSFKNFKFYKDGDKLIPHKFILVLTKKADYDAFVGDITATKTKFETVLTSNLGITLTSTAATATTAATDATDMTPILKNDITDEDSINPKEDIRDKNVIKIIAKYLLILGHLNYNRVEYNREVVSTTAPIKTQETVDANKKKIFELKTLNLYKLISNVSYNDTYDGLDDTFITITDIAAGIVTGKITDPKYKTLTYIYNYLETKYVSLSSNNNKNYLLNVIQSVNNTLNNDDKTIIPAAENKTSKYIFADYIKELKTLKYEDEDEILNKAIHISTTSFETTYYMNILILGCYIFFTTIKSV